jgi:diacylglycerol kinase family enzyme
VAVNDSREAAIFVNEGAGTATSRRVRRTVELARRGLSADVFVTATRSAPKLGAWLQAHAAGYRTVVVAGGDGSLAVAYNVLQGREVTLGYIPAGFGNATAHLLHLPRDPAALVAVLARRQAHSVDMVRVDGRLALFAGAGWDAVAAGRYAASRMKGVPGWAGAIARSLPDLSRRALVRVEAREVAEDPGAAGDAVRAETMRVVHEGPMVLLVASTTPWYGRGLLVNPGARADAAHFTVRVYRGPAMPFAAEAARWALRRSPEAPATRARAISITSLDGRPVWLQADGDPIGARERWELAIAPEAARLIGAW